MEYWQYWKCETDDVGRQVWSFTPPKEFSGYSDKDWESVEGQKFLTQMGASFFSLKNQENPNSADKVYRQQKEVTLTPQKFSDKVFESAYNGIQYYQTLQADSGHWPGDYGGPLFLTPGLIIASYVTGVPFPAPYRELIKQYFLNHQNADGGWGLHIEAPSTMFGTVLQYVALRILGMKAEDAPALKAKTWIHNNGGATGIPSWGKFYLSVLGAYNWDGVNSLIPEMWLVPRALPVHPGRYWCHARMVYLPMAYCYGKKVVGEITPLVKELREELYTESYDKINWSQARNKCAAADLYYPQSGVLKVFNRLLNVYEKVAIKSLRKKATDFILEYVDAEDDHTKFIDIGPVNQVINSICVWHAYGKDSVQFKKHTQRWYDYLWLAEDGMKMNGYNGSQLWDTAFATQAIVENGFEKHFPEAVKKAFKYVDVSQVKVEVRDHKKFFRHDSVGGWPFSNVDHGWPITDCTAEGLKTSLLVSEASNSELKIADDRLKQAADLILYFQNKNGGWATYELTRAPEWLELLNPSEVFGNIMIDYSYVECSSACVQSLIRFSKHYPDYKKQEIEQAVRKGISYIISQQRDDGSWYGSWAVCFTYGGWFAVEALTAVLEAGMMRDSEAMIKNVLDKAAKFLLSKQNADGGWGESFQSCVEKKYVQNATSQIVNTSWAILSLMALNYPDKTVIEKAVTLLQSRQFENGDFPQENISGVFNHNCSISYTAYRNVFPIWALGRYWKMYGGGVAGSIEKNALSELA